MGLLDRLAGALGYAPRKAPSRSKFGFDAAGISRLTDSLRTESVFINTTLRYELRRLRARSRQAAQNNPFARRYVNMVVANVAGPHPFRLEGKVKFKSGQPDDLTNDRIEEAWRGWTKPGSCEITGKWSYKALQRLLVRNLAVDGELLVRKLRGPEFGPYGYKLQVIDVDRLYELKNESFQNGGAIHAGVEVDPYGKPVAYHLLKRRPSQWQFAGYTLEFERVPADDMMHIFIPESAEQVRGVPWMYAALLNLVHLGAFEEAAVIAARVGAANMGFIQSPDGGKGLADQQGEDAAGEGSEPTINSEPGAYQFLPPGYEAVKGMDARYPDAAMEPFIRACLRGVAAGLDVAYHNLANDLENVNYSSARIGEMDERDAWMVLQTFWDDHVEHPNFEAWLPQAVMANKLPFDLGKLEKYKAVYFQARRWQYIDPMKEVGAAIEAMDAKLKSRTRIIAEGGEDIEDVFDEIKAEIDMAKEKNISLDPVQPKVSGAVNQPGVEPGDAGDTPAGENPQGKGKRKRWREPAYQE